MPEQLLIENCSPTPAGLKPSNLISLPYPNLEQAEASFRRFRRCTTIYQRAWAQGRTLEELTVAS